MENPFQHLQKDFPILQRTLHGRPLCYVDNAATTQMPQHVLDAMHEYQTTYHANIHRSSHTLGEDATAAYEEVRKKVAHFIGAQDSSEIIFTSGTTAGINYISSSWGNSHIKSGDEILITQLEHHANILPWQQLAKRTCATLRYLPVTPDGTLDIGQLHQLLTTKTKLLAITGSSNATGTQTDLRTIIDAAHTVGTKVLVDAAQMVAHQKIDVTELDADFVVFSGHKMFGPTGVGVLYIKKELHDQVTPCLFGGGMVHEASMEHATFLPIPHGLEAGTPPTAQVIGLGAAIDYIEQHVAFNTLKQYEASLCARLIDGLTKLPTVTVLGPIEQLKQSGHLVSFVVDDMHAHDVAAYLDRQGICARAGHHCAQPLAKALGYAASTRVSFAAYNSPADADRVIETITKIFCKQF